VRNLNGFHRFTTPNPASFHACQPPTSALAFDHPAFLNWRAARALVASSIQAQYKTSVAFCDNLSDFASRTG
jgi:hypothetical protein